MIVGQRENGRHDAVTARAILRLSHGVSQLTASNSPNSVHRGLRCRYAKKGRKTEEHCSPHSGFKIHRCSLRKEHLHQTEWNYGQAAGSKRKWSTDNCYRRQGTSMDVDHYTSNLHEVPLDTGSNSVSSRLSNSPISRRENNDLMLTEFTDRSSCSSVTSHRRSSSSTDSPQNTSSDEDQPKSCHRKPRTGEIAERKLPAFDPSMADILPRRLDTTAFRPQTSSSTAASYSVCRNKQAGRSRRQTNCPSSGGSNTTIAGDSSDGLSVKLKIPRLSSIPTAVLPTTSSVPNRRGRCKENGTARKSRLCENHALHYGWQCHASGKYTMTVDCKDSKTCRQCSRHRAKSRNACGRHAIPHREGSTSSSSSSRNSSPDCLYSGHRASDSGEDLANDEQSDFPADERPPISRLTHRTLQNSHPFPRFPGPNAAQTAGSRLSSIAVKCPLDSRAEGLQKRTSFPLIHSLLPPLTLETQEIDSELEAIMDSTWPMLSNRAKAAYLQGISRAGHRRQSINNSVTQPRSSLKPKQQPLHGSIRFVPSILGPITSHGSEKLAITQDAPSVGRGMPIPPWEREDMDEDSLSDGQGQPSSETAIRTKTRRYSDAVTPHPSVDSWKPTVSLCPPLSETNVGHQMLQKLGWRPGVGLGLRSQGILTPVGCSFSSELNCDLTEAEKHGTLPP